jgi:membrane protein
MQEAPSQLTPTPTRGTVGRALEFARRVGKGLYDYNAFDHAATMSFYFFLGLIPLMVFAGFLLGQVVQERGADTLASPLFRLMPRAAAQLVADELRVMGNASPKSIAPLSLLGFLILTSNGIHNLMDVFELVTRAPHRAWWKQRLLSIGWVILSLLVVCGAVWFVLAIDKLLSGDVGAATSLLHRVIMRAHRMLAGTWAQLGAISLFAVILSAGLGAFYWLSVAHPPHIRRIVWPGTFAAMFCWVLVSWAFGQYVARLGQYAVYYGSLATVAVMLVWLYLTSLSILLGAEVNAQLEGVRDHYRLRLRPKKSPATVRPTSVAAAIRAVAAAAAPGERGAGSSLTTPLPGVMTPVNSSPRPASAATTTPTSPTATPLSPATPVSPAATATPVSPAATATPISPATPAAEPAPPTLRNAAPAALPDRGVDEVLPAGNIRGHLLETTAGPPRMLAHRRVGVRGGEGPERGEQVGAALVGDHRDGVAQQPRRARSPERRPLADRRPCLLAEREQIGRRHRSPPLQRGEELRSLRWARLGAVERTDVLAHVAAEEAVPHALPERLGHRPLALDSEERDAPTRVEHERRGERLRRAGVEAPRARPAALGHRLVGQQLQRGDDLAEQHIRALPGDDDDPVLAHEPQPRPRRPGALEHGRRVDDGPRLDPGRQAPHERREPLQPAPRSLVVVATPGVACDQRRHRARRRLAGLVGPRIARCDTDDAPRAGQDPLAIEPPTHLSVVCQVGELTLEPCVEERLVALELALERDICASEPHRVEPELARVIPHRLLMRTTHDSRARRAGQGEQRVTQRRNFRYVLRGSFLTKRGLGHG